MIVLPLTPTGRATRRSARRCAFTLALAATALAAATPAIAQLQPGHATANVGDTVVGWPNGSGSKPESCQVTALLLSQRAYMVKCPSGEFALLFSQVGKMTPEAAAALAAAAPAPAGAAPGAPAPGNAAPGAPAPGGAVAGAYKVGDRVEIDSLDLGRWEPGVVIAANADGWLVRTDKTGSEQSIPNVPDYLRRIRPSSAALPQNQQIDRTQPTGILDCPWKSGITRKAFNTTVIRNLIRCNYDWKNGNDDLKRFDINKFTRGGARRWNVNSDIGPGTPSTLVYPIRVEYTWRQWSKQYVQTRTGIMLFNCFYGTVGYWECGLGQKISESQPVTRPRG